MSFDQDQTDSIMTCRICLEDLVSTKSALSINEYAEPLSLEKVLISDMIKKSFPEMDLDICDSPVICKSCNNLLLSTYILKSKSYQTEQKILLYKEKNNVKIGDKIDLANVTKNEVAINTNYKKKIRDIKVVSNNDMKLIGDPEPESNSESEKEKSTSRSVSHFKRSFSCDKCEYKSYRLDLLKKHMNKCKVKEEPKIFECHICSYSTCRKRNLKRHVMVHGGDRPYTCGVCGKGFTEMHYVRVHMYKHSRSPRPFKCQEAGCSSSFTRKWDLNAHMIRHVKDHS